MFEVKMQQEEMKERISEFMMKNKLEKEDNNIKNIEYQKTFQLGLEPVICFSVLTTDEESPEWVTLFSPIPMEKGGIPNGAYNAKLFNKEIVEKIGSDIYQSVFHLHVGIVHSHRSNMEFIMLEKDHSTIH